MPENKEPQYGPAITNPFQGYNELWPSSKVAQLQLVVETLNKWSFIVDENFSQRGMVSSHHWNQWENFYEETKTSLENISNKRVVSDEDIEFIMWLNSKMAGAVRRDQTSLALSTGGETETSGMGNVYSSILEKLRNQGAPSKSFFW